MWFVAILPAACSLLLMGNLLASESKETSGQNATSKQVQLAWLSINTGGATEQSSTNFASGLTCGQSVSGACQSANFRVNFGFWQTGVTAPTDVQEIPSGELPLTFSLSQNYPNPFNPSTVIEFTVPRRSQVEVLVYNLLGQMVVNLVDQPMSQGTYRTTWDGRDESGGHVASGVYFYRLKAEHFVQVKKMILLK